MSALFSKALAWKFIHGVAATKHGPKISHLFFDNDSIVFGDATLDEASRVKSILKNYEEAFRQQVNFNKSAIVFSKNTMVIV